MQTCDYFFFCLNAAIIIAFLFFFNLHLTNLCFNGCANCNVMRLIFFSLSNFHSSNRSTLLTFITVRK